MERDTQSLRDILDTSNKNSNPQEEENMASANDKKKERQAELKRQAEEAAKKAAEEQAAKDAQGETTEEQDPEVPTTELTDDEALIEKHSGIKISDMTEAGIKQEDGTVKPYPTDDSTGQPYAMQVYKDILLADAIIAEEAVGAGNQSGDRTNLFNDNGQGGQGGSSADGEEKPKTPEELAADAEKEKRKAEREAAILEANELIKEATSKLINQTASIELTPLQKEFRQAASSKFISRGIIVESNPYPELTVSRKALAVKGVPVLQAGVNPEEFQRHLSEKFENQKKFNLQDYSMVLNYKYHKAGAVIGGVLSFPGSMNITNEAFETDNFTINPNAVLKEEEHVTIVANFDTLFTYILLYCGGKIKEDPIMSEGKFLGAKTAEHKIEAVLDNKIVTKEDKKVTEERRVIRAINRKQLCVQDNIIPIKIYKTIDLSRVAQDPATKTGIMKALTKSRDRKKKENTTPVTKMDKDQASLFTYALDESGNISQLKCALVGGNAVPGKGAYTKLGLNHWSSYAKDSQGKDVAYIVPSNPIVSYTEVQKSKTDPEMRQIKTFSVLGAGATFDDLIEMGYPAAGVVKGLGIKEGAIKEVYTAYLEAQKRAREEKLNSQAGGKRRAPKRGETVIDQDLSAKILIQQLNQSSQVNMGMDGAGVSAAIMSNVYNI